MKHLIIIGLILLFVFSGLHTIAAAGQVSDFQFISPRPGSNNNTQESTIIIRHGSKIDLSSASVSGLIEVTGSESGPVSGETVLSSDGKTVIFKPYQKFLPEETVFVEFNSGLISYSGESVPSCAFSFKIAHHITFSIPSELSGSVRKIKSSVLPGQNTGHRLKAGELPAMTVTVCDSDAVDEGYIFMAVAAEVPNIGYYLMILNNDGTPFFTRELLNDYAYDFKVQPNGLLSYAQLTEHHSYSGGGDCIHMIMDNTFTVVDSFQMGNGYIAESHDFQLLPNGHALLFGYYLTEVDMSKIVDGGYPNALVSGGVIQELDADKNVVFQWRTWDYFDFDPYLREKRRTANPIVSAFHLNTITLDTDGHIIVATPLIAKKINRQTGDIIWNLGGDENEFSFAGIDSTAGISAVSGHMFYRIDNGNFLVYDNGARSGDSGSEIHEFRLDEQNLVAELIWTYTPDQIINGWHRGNAQRLPNGNTFIGWGGASGSPIPACTEVTPDGEKVFELSFDNPDVESYRAFRFPFPDGQPAADVFVESITPGGSYAFEEGENNDTGVTLRINTMVWDDYTGILGERYNYAPMGPKFPGKTPLVKPARFVLTPDGIQSMDADLMFDVNKWNIDNPELCVVYRRQYVGNPNDIFLPLPTTYNPATEMLNADVAGGGEFIVAWPDFESIVYTPWPIHPSDEGLVNQDLPVTLTWTPVGYVNKYNLEVSLTEDFTNIIVTETNFKEAYYTMDNLTANTNYYWRIQSKNDAGTSDWTATQKFTTVPPFVTVTVPNGDEEWKQGLSYFIQWDDNIDEDVILELYQNQTLVTVIDTTESSGAYKWEVPLVLPNGAYTILARSVNSETITDQSDNPFNLNDETGIAEADRAVITDFKLLQNYPNPFNPETEIKFEIPEDAFVVIKVYDVKGTLVGTPVQKQISAGRHAVSFLAADLASGIYFYTLESGDFFRTRKMMLLK